MLPIVFPIPTTLKQQYDLPRNRGLFDGDRLVLPIARDNYKAPNPDRTTIVRGYATNFVTIERDLFEFEATIDDHRQDIEHILRTLIQTATIDPCQYDLITCYDYHTLSNDLARTRGYTERKGILKIEPLGGSVDSAWGRASKGLRLIFTESE